MSFSTEKAVQKLKTLDGTQQSIQSTSQWCLFHYRHCHDIVTLWMTAFTTPNEFNKDNQSDCMYRLSLFYLCNDILQFSKKQESKYSVYLNEFSQIMKQVMEIVANDSASAHLKGKYDRVLQVWMDRAVYKPGFIKSIQTDRLQVNSNNGQSHPVPGKVVPSMHTSSHVAPHVAPHVPHIVPNFNSIPEKFIPIIEKYKELEDIDKKYHKDLSSYKKTVDEFLKNGDDGNKAVELSNILSSLSSLGGGTETTNNSNDDMNDEERELERLQQIQQDGKILQQRNDDINQMRDMFSSQLYQLADSFRSSNGVDELADLQSMLSAREWTLQESKNLITVYNYEDGGETGPVYAEDSDSDKDNVNDDSDIDGDEKENENADDSESEPDHKRAKI